MHLVSHSYLTADLPGIGGAIKLRPEDFLVEEIPAYQPIGEGEHLYLTIERSRRTTLDMVRRLADVFRVRRGDIGYAGLKDKQAVTRQQFSIHQLRRGHEDHCIELLRQSGVTVLSSRRHGNKLRLGHLAGNRFVILVRGASGSAVADAQRVMEVLVRRGVPNYIGAQRFGYRGDNDVLGRHLLLGQWRELVDRMLGSPRPYESDSAHAARGAYDRGDYLAALEAWPRHLRVERRVLDMLRQGRSAEQAVRAMDRDQCRFLISALQSSIFNRVLHQRIGMGLFDSLTVGDLAWKHDGRAVFAVDEAVAAAENASAGRVARQEVSPSGPMWGASMTRAGGEVARWELEALTAQGLDESDLSAGDFAPRGERRSLRELLRHVDVGGGADEHGPFVRIAFELGRGCFATIVLREIMKADIPDDDATAI